MSIEFPELPNWTFTVEEVPAGICRAVGTDRPGHKVVSSGTDTDALLQECRAAAGAHVHP